MTGIDLILIIYRQVHHIITIAVLLRGTASH